MRSEYLRLVPAPMLRFARVVRRSSRLRQVRRWIGRLPEAREGRPLPPPQHLIDVLGIGGGDFLAIGDQFARYLRDLCGLDTNGSVLDIGCGLGRMAVPLTEYLGATGSYAGFDISQESIAWCTKTITSLHPNFRFQFADIRNKQYNPKGHFLGSEFSFPYQNESFDCVFAASVFTHIRPREVERYLAETRRVLRPEGRCLLTFFVLNAESLCAMGQGKSQFDFRHDMGGFWTVNKEVPEGAIAYREADVRTMLQSAMLEPVEPMLYGGWSGRDTWFDGQDIVIASKVRGPAHVG
jgi:SAM-dependent methyltransferase